MSISLDWFGLINDSHRAKTCGRFHLEILNFAEATGVLSGCRPLLKCSMPQLGCSVVGISVVQNGISGSTCPRRVPAKEARATGPERTRYSKKSMAPITDLEKCTVPNAREKRNMRKVRLFPRLPQVTCVPDWEGHVRGVGISITAFFVRLDRW
jgi:hypothetical protein